MNINDISTPDDGVPEKTIFDPEVRPRLERVMDVAHQHSRESVAKRFLKAVDAVIDDPELGPPVSDDLKFALTKEAWIARLRGPTVLSMLPPKFGVRLDSVTPEQQQWLWEERIPLGAITIFEGDPGCGKSSIASDIAAHITRGTPFFDGTTCPFGQVIWMSSEENLKSVVVPRLTAQGGNVARVISLPPFDKGQSYCFPKDLECIGQLAIQNQVKMIVIDPLEAFISDGFNANANQDMRKALYPLKEYAERNDFAVIIIRHLNKSTGMNSLHRGGGSMAIAAVSRAIYTVGKDKNDRSENPQRILAPGRVSGCLEPKSLAFRLEGPKRQPPCVVWCGDSKISASELLSQEVATPESAIDEAKEFLKAELANGPVAQKTVEADAKREGISYASLRRAKKDLGVFSIGPSAETGEHWTWSLTGAQPVPSLKS